MRSLNIIILIITLVLFSSCDEESEIQSKGYPFVITQSPIVNNLSVHLSADLTLLGQQEILKYGFVWSTTSIPTIHDNSVLFDTKARKGVYSYDVIDGLTKDETYYVRACVLTEEYEVYGTLQSFYSLGSQPPVITNFSPQRGYAGENIIIEGVHFTDQKSNIVVKFGDENATIDSLSDGKIYLKSPVIRENTNVKISIEVAGMKTFSATNYSVLYAWTEKESYPGRDNYSAAYFTMNNYGYMVGGKEYIEQIRGPQCHALWRYDADKDSWQRMSNLPFKAHERTGTCVIEGIAYVFSYGSTPCLYKYDDISDSWTQETTYPGSGVAFSTFVIKDDVYVGLGTDYNHLYQEFFKYSTVTKVWTPCAPFPGRGRYKATSFSLNGKGYVAFGKDFYNYYKDIWEYNPATNVWLQKNDFPEKERSMASSFKHKGKVYLGLGTQEYNYKGYANIWEYQQDADSWEKKDAYIGNAKWNNTVFTLNDKAYIGIGQKSNGGGSSWTIWKNYKDLWEFNPNLE